MLGSLSLYIYTRATVAEARAMHVLLFAARVMNLTLFLRPASVLGFGQKCQGEEAAAASAAFFEAASGTKCAHGFVTPLPAAERAP